MTKADVEMFYNGLISNHVPTSEDDLHALKAKLTDLTHTYSKLSPQWNNSPFQGEHYRALKSLRNNAEIVITKADKGGNCVILNKSDYVMKMKSILNDEAKFTMLGPVEKHGRTACIERKFVEYLRKLRTDKEITDEVMNHIRPVGSQRPRLYGLPKIHKPDVPLRPILSTVNSSQRAVANYLKSLLDPVHKKYSTSCIEDSFKFAKMIQETKSNDQASFMCSYDIKSLFTNIPLKEVIEICVKSLYDDDKIQPPPFSRDVFKKLLEFAMCDLEFSFDNIMYRQVNGCGMGNVLSSILSDIYVGYHEKQIFSEEADYLPKIYKRYVDDTFSLFDNEESSEKFLNRLNQIPSLEFTIEKEENGKLPFLDVLIEKSNNDFITSVFRKPSFAATYQKWSSFVPLSRKLNVIGTLTHRALCICSKSTLSNELKNIRRIFHDNGYPPAVVDVQIRRKVTQLNSLQSYGPEKKAVYLRMPYMGVQSEKMVKTVRDSVKNTFLSVNFRIVFATQSILPFTKKDALPSHAKSNLIYKFQCKRCESAHIGRCYPRLEDRIAEHVPAIIRKRRKNSNEEWNTSEEGINRKISYYRLRSKPVDVVQPLGTLLPRVSKSAIGSHLLENPACAEQYDSSCFQVFASGRNKYHTDVMEGVFINSEKPILCRQKDFVYAVKLFQK